MTTQITDSMTKARTALEAMDANAARVREVAMRLLSEHADRLPKLLAVRTQADQDGPYLGLQPRTNEDTVLWAEALGVALKEDVMGASKSGWRQLHVSGELIVDGVKVRLGSCQHFSSAAWAARTAEAVAA